MRTGYGGFGSMWLPFVAHTVCPEAMCIFVFVGVLSIVFLGVRMQVHFKYTTVFAAVCCSYITVG